MVALAGGCMAGVGGGVTPVLVGGLRQGWLWWWQEGRVGTWDHGG